MPSGLSSRPATSARPRGVMLWQPVRLRTAMDAMPASTSTPSSVTCARRSRSHWRVAFRVRARQHLRALVCHLLAQSKTDLLTMVA